MRLRAVRQHGPNLAAARAGGLENDVAPVGGPAGALVASGVASDLDDPPRGHVHDVNVVVARGSAPTKGQKLAVGGPRWIDEIALIWNVKFRRVRAVSAHGIEFWNAAAIAYEDDGLPSLGIPCGRGAYRVGKRETLGMAAVGVGSVQLGIALHGGRKNQLRAIRGPRRRAVGAAEAREGNYFARVHRIHADLRTDDGAKFGETGEGDARSVGGPARGQRDGVEIGERVLIRTVIIHDPKFFGAAALADVGDLRASDAGKAAGQFADDFIGELMGEFADLGIGWRAAIDFADDGLRGRVADVVEPRLNVDFRGGFDDVSESHHVGVCGGVGPIEVAEFVGDGGRSC